MTEAVLEQHRALARQAARQAMVLLRNTGVLPLKKAGTIAVIGPMADIQRDVQGPMPALGDPQEVVTMLAGIRGVAGDKAHVRQERTRVVLGKRGAVRGDLGGWRRK